MELTTLTKSAESLQALGDAAILGGHAASHEITGELTGDALAAHHLLKMEIARRGLDAPCELSTPLIIEKRRMTVKDYADHATDMPMGLIASLRQAVQEGSTMVDVMTLLSGAGYELAVTPVPVDAEDEGELAEMIMPTTDEDVPNGDMNCPDCAGGCTCSGEACSCWSGCDCADCAEDEEDDDEEEESPVVELLEAIAGMLSLKKGYSFATENALIARNKKRKGSSEPHDFVPAKYATRKGKVRCMTCGGDQPADGVQCNASTASPRIIVKADGQTSFVFRDGAVDPATRTTGGAQDFSFKVIDTDGSVSKADLSVGDFVSWDSSGGTARGKITRIVRDGKIDVPNSSFTINGTEDDPAALITIYRGGKATSTKVGHKLSTLRKIEPIAKADTYTPPQGVQEEAKRALEWIKDGKAGSNFTAVGRARAVQLANGKAVSLDTIKRMHSFLSRHAVDSEGEGYNPGDKGYPSAGRVAYAAWGGKPALSWVKSILDDVEKAQARDRLGRFAGSGSGSAASGGGEGGGDTAAAQNVADRHAAEFKDLSPSAKSDTTGALVHGRYQGAKQIASASSKAQAESIVSGHKKAYQDSLKTNPKIDDTAHASKAGMFEGASQAFSARFGGVSKAAKPHAFVESKDGAMCADCKMAKDHWTHKVAKAQIVNKATTDEERYTLAPVYIPDTQDAHGEWTDANELQHALWDYTRSGDRRIRLQHNRDVVAGEWVELMTFPFAMSAPMKDAEGNETQMDFPANTAFMGIIWEPWAWSLVKSGKLRGLSIGGKAQRIEADLPEPDVEKDGPTVNDVHVDGAMGAYPRKPKKPKGTVAY